MRRGKRVSFYWTFPGLQRRAQAKRKDFTLTRVAGEENVLWFFLHNKTIAKLNTRSRDLLTFSVLFTRCSTSNWSNLHAATESCDGKISYLTLLRFGVKRKRDKWALRESKVSFRESSELKQSCTTFIIQFHALSIFSMFSRSFALFSCATVSQLKASEKVQPPREEIKTFLWKFIDASNKKRNIAASFN